MRCQFHCFNLNDCFVRKIRFWQAVLLFVGAVVHILIKKKSIIISFNNIFNLMVGIGVILLKLSPNIIYWLLFSVAYFLSQNILWPFLKRFQELLKFKRPTAIIKFHRKYNRNFSVYRQHFVITALLDELRTMHFKFAAHLLPLFLRIHEKNFKKINCSGQLLATSGRLKDFPVTDKLWVVTSLPRYVKVAVDLFLLLAIFR